MLTGVNREYGVAVVVAHSAQGYAIQVFKHNDVKLAIYGLFAKSTPCFPCPKRAFWPVWCEFRCDIDKSPIQNNDD
jgi:hypothetical protein